MTRVRSASSGDDKHPHSVISLDENFCKVVNKTVVTVSPFANVSLQYVTSLARSLTESARTILRNNKVKMPRLCWKLQWLFGIPHGGQEVLDDFK
mmetsp:Transcript_52436/g.97068  ORF Transcript_52436/g.97068 Transcript_52436/m.97068 type:complete len:95 (+) Transcript_52436:2378-2662(+)